MKLKSQHVVILMALCMISAGTACRLASQREEASLPTATMQAGSAALLPEGFGGVTTTAKGTTPGRAIGLCLTPIEVNALLMNNGETNIINDPLTSALALITRIGGGEVRVDRALVTP